jgi:hypothetical protein
MEFQSLSVRFPFDFSRQESSLSLSSMINDHDAMLLLFFSRSNSSSESGCYCSDIYVRYYEYECYALGTLFGRTSELPGSGDVFSPRTKASIVRSSSQRKVRSQLVMKRSHHPPAVCNTAKTAAASSSRGL